MIRFFLPLMLITCLFTVANGQTEDCVGAYPVCGNGDISLSPDGIGFDDMSLSGNVPPSCGFQENQSIWLRFQIKEAGTLGFDLIPTDLEGPDRDDYDFALYGPNVPCNNLGSSIRCSSTNPQQAGVQAETGMNEEESDNSEGPGSAGNGYIHWLDNVEVGDTYYLLIDNFDQDQGFRLEWNGSALLEDRITKENGGVDLGEDINLCENSTVTIDATTLGGVEYEWSTGTTGEELDVEEAGTYSVQVTTASGCFSRDTIEVFTVPVPTIDFVNATPDEFCEPGTVQLSTGGDAEEFEWFDPEGNSLGTGTSVNVSDINSTRSGLFSVTARNQFGCDFSEQVAVTVRPVYSFEISEQRCPGQVFEIPGTNQSVVETDTVQVNYTSVYGCDSTYIYNVNFLSCGSPECTSIPSGFTPDGNGVNDQFRPLLPEICNPTNFKLTIFNRWGEAVFQTSDYLEGWDGTSEAKKAPNGYYLWIIEYSFPGAAGEVEKLSGGVTLLR